MIEKQIINLWIGKQSQQCAFNFYNLQAQQIFDEQQDPLLHSSIWKNLKKLQPRMLIFDTNIERLAAVRQLDTRKILQKMKKQQNYNSLHGIFSHIDTTPLQKHQQNLDKNKQTQWPLITNWTDRQQNYYIIDPGYTTIPTTTKQNPDIQLQRFAVYEQFYKVNKELTQNRLRKQLQNTDFLKLFTICTDQDNSGFTSNMVQYLREQCPKKCYLLTSLSSSNNIHITSMSKLYNELDVYLPINLNNLKHPYFKNTTINSQLAPYFSSLYTPFIMKQVDPYFYISTIVTDNRKLFNTAYTLPIIDQQLNLHETTNIFKYLQAMQYDENQKEKDKNKNKKKQKEQQEQKIEKYKGQKKQQQKHQQQQQHEQYKINFTNQTYLSLKQLKKKGKFVSQSYILKGHFNNLQKTFKPKSQPSALSIKYLKGIFSAPVQPTLSYNNYYNAAYGQKVQAYPFHLVMFNHEYFGEGLRKNITMLQKNKIFNQEWVESKEMVLSVADMYMEVHQESD